MNLDPLVIAGCCFLGSIIAGVIGWMKSGSPFVARTFMSAVLSGLGSALGYALAFKYSNSGLTTYDILSAVGAGLGVQVAVSRISGAIAARARKKVNG